MATSMKPLRRSAHHTLGAVLMALALLGCDPYRPLPDSAIDGAAAPRFVEGACPSDVQLGFHVRCGTVKVPRVRGADDPTQLPIAVFVVDSAAAIPERDPVVYLEGGPGGAASDWLPALSMFAPVLERRALVLVDQRGTGRSEPALLCNGDDVATCRARLAGEGVDLAAYHTSAIAADLDDVRRALGYERWNLLGISYGTRLGLGILRDFPAGVRAAVIDSVAPPEADWLGDTAPGIERSFRAIFDACSADKRCSAAYPDLEKTFWALVDALDAKPATTTVGGRMTTVDGNAALNLFLLLAYDPGSIAALPELVFAMRDGDLTGYARMQSLLDEAFSDFADGMYLSVTCRDVAPFSSAEAVAAKEATVRPRLARAFAQGGLFATCRTWNVPPSPPIEHEPVTSDVPTLVLSGAFDPITPPAWAHEAVQHLSAGQLFDRPDASHGVFFTDCGAAIVKAFLADPASRSAPACASDPTLRLAFAIPDKRLAAAGLTAARTGDFDWKKIADRVIAAARAGR
jgi:pimeloyl-ACP methyl ester carboxylesterase